MAEPGLFQVQINEQGKMYLRKFAAISYVLMGLVVFSSGVSIYYNVKLLLMMRATRDSGPAFLPHSMYDKLAPYISIFVNIIVIVANTFYLRFPRVITRSLAQGDESGANNAFNLLLKGAWVFLLGLITGCAEMIWVVLFR